LLGGLVVALALEIAVNDRGPVLLRQTADLLVQHAAQLLPRQVIERLRARHFYCPPFVVTSCRRLGARTESDMLGDTVKPTGQRSFFPD
jgi:hypothetical protein